MMQPGERERIVHRLPRRGQCIGLEERRVRFKVLLASTGEAGLRRVRDAVRMLHMIEWLVYGGVFGKGKRAKLS